MRGWKTPPDHADITPAHEALMLWEGVREAARTEAAGRQPRDFQIKLADAEQTAKALRDALRAPESLKAVEAAFAKVGPSCSACHERYRNE
jgi:cytochrome c556